MAPKDRIALAHDAQRNDNRAFLYSLSEYVGVVKLGPRMYLPYGPDVMNWIAAGQKVFLDLKFHDIPETGAGSIEEAIDLGVDFATIHVQQRATLEKVAKLTLGTKLKVLAVTVLTSMTQQDLRDLGTDVPPEHAVLHRARFAYDCGIRGFVCSPQEVKLFRETFPDAFLVTPGIRPAGSAAGDQQRIGTPGDAIRNGADLIVVGRPIYDQPDPLAAAKAIHDEVAGALAAP